MSITPELTSRLVNPAIIRWTGPLPAASTQGGSSDARAFSVNDPATGNQLASLPNLGRPETKAAISAAAAAQKAWASRTGKERAHILRRWYDLIIANADDLATIVTSEMGKPLAEAYSEILYGASYVEWFAEEAKRTYGDVIPAHRRDTRISVIKQPIGVVAAITPWNFPVAMVARKVAPALAVGCAIVLKPATETPLSAIALAALAEDAGLPAGLFSVISTRDSQGFGDEICENPAIRKLTFTGSTQVGRLLMAKASQRVLRLSLELGGNAPFIVFDSADVDAAVDGAIVAKFRNAGQTCVCANRIYVQSKVHDEFVAMLAARIAALSVGNGMSQDTHIGPLINDKAVEKMLDHVDDALAKGALVKLGGSRHALGGRFVQPTLLTGVTASMKVAREETFGPLAPVFKFNTVDEVIGLANDSEYGLAAYFYGRDINLIVSVAEALEYGIIGINTGLISTEVAPFGGMKQSGFGREGSKYGVEDYLEMKYICLGGLDAVPA